jgi:hypothetical protein
VRTLIALSITFTLIAVGAAGAEARVPADTARAWVTEHYLDKRLGWDGTMYVRSAKIGDCTRGECMVIARGVDHDTDPETSFGRFVAMLRVKVWRKHGRLVGKEVDAAVMPGPPLKSELMGGVQDADQVAGARAIIPAR